MGASSCSRNGGGSFVARLIGGTMATEIRTKSGHRRYLAPARMPDCGRSRSSDVRLSDPIWEPRRRMTTERTIPEHACVAGEQRAARQLSPRRWEDGWPFLWPLFQRHRCLQMAGSRRLGAGDGGRPGARPAGRRSYRHRRRQPSNRTAISTTSTRSISSRNAGLTDCHARALLRGASVSGGGGALPRHRQDESALISPARSPI